MKTSHSVVKRLVADEEFRTRALANPESALAEYDLPRTEKRSLTALCRKMASHGVAAAIAAAAVAPSTVEPMAYWL